MYTLNKTFPLFFTGRKLSPLGRVRWNVGDGVLSCKNDVQ